MVARRGRGGRESDENNCSLSPLYPQRYDAADSRKAREKCRQPARGSQSFDAPPPPIMAFEGVVLFHNSSRYQFLFLIACRVDVYVPSALLDSLGKSLM